MIELVEAFPLQWPDGFERSRIKKNSAFQCTLGQARDGVLKQISMLRGTNVIISSNIPVKNNGDLYASKKPVDGDHGVAVYFTWKNQQYVLACDNYDYIQDNLRAIEKSIDAIRGLERWGASDILARAFSGFKALGEAKKDNWWDILDVPRGENKSAIKQAFNKLAKTYHPDNKRTGNHETFIKIKRAYDEALS